MALTPVPSCCPGHVGPVCPRASTVRWSSPSRSQESEALCAGLLVLAEAPGPWGIAQPAAAALLVQRPRWGCRVAPDAGGEGVSVRCASTLPSRSLGGSGTGVLLRGLEAPGLPGAFWDGSAEMPPACCGLPAGSAQVGQALCQSPAVLTRINLKTFPLPRWGPIPVSGDQALPSPWPPRAPFLSVDVSHTWTHPLRGLCLVPSLYLVGLGSVLAPARGQGRSCAWGTVCAAVSPSQCAFRPLSSHALTEFCCSEHRCLCGQVAGRAGLPCRPGPKRQAVTDAHWCCWCVGQGPRGSALICYRPGPTPSAS